METVMRCPSATIPVDAAMFRDLLRDCESRLALLAEARSRELLKPLQQRSVPLLRFFDKEQAVYAFGAALLGRLRDGVEPVRAAEGATSRP